MPRKYSDKKASHICRNCGSKTTGVYCSHCGQSNDTGRLSWASLADGFLSSFIGDGAIGDKRSNIRYGFLMTLRAIVVHPGQTVAEYLEGRRRKYFNPVTILLLLSGFYALIGAWCGIIDDTPPAAGTQIGQYLNMLKAYSDGHPALFHLLLLPFTALSYKWIFRRQSSLKYVEYAYIGIFWAIFSVLLLFLKLPFESAPLEPHRSYATYGVLIFQGWFAANVFRRLFGVKRKRAVWCWIKSVLISYSLFIAVIVLLSILTVGAYRLTDPAGYRKTFDVVMQNYEDNPPHEDADSLRTQ